MLPGHDVGHEYRRHDHWRVAVPVVPHSRPVADRVTVDVADARAATLVLLAGRAPGATVCPSEVARALAKGRDAENGDWRSMMPIVHAAVDRLLADGQVHLSWKRRPLEARSGPYRINDGPAGDRE
ncbi:MAG: DUF3253 domain-containing protein [Sphingomonas sp.]|nr:MAG: DUF3253 domain-containing protein [Sphingomonas sp.]